MKLTRDVRYRLTRAAITSGGTSVTAVISETTKAEPRGVLVMPVLQATIIEVASTRT